MKSMFEKKLGLGLILLLVLLTGCSEGRDIFIINNDSNASSGGVTYSGVSPIVVDNDSNTIAVSSIVTDLNAGTNITLDCTGSDLNGSCTINSTSGSQVTDTNTVTAGFTNTSGTIWYSDLNINGGTFHVNNSPSGNPIFSVVNAGLVKAWDSLHVVGQFGVGDVSFIHPIEFNSNDGNVVVSGNASAGNNVLLGGLYFASTDGSGQSNVASYMPSVRAYGDGIYNGGDYPSRLELWTTNDEEAWATKKIEIGSEGDLTIFEGDVNNWLGLGTFADVNVLDDLIVNGSLILSSPLPVASGGTGLSSWTADRFVYSSGTGTLASSDIVAYIDSDEVRLGYDQDFGRNLWRFDSSTYAGSWYSVMKATSNSGEATANFGVEYNSNSWYFDTLDVTIPNELRTDSNVFHNIALNEQFVSGIGINSPVSSPTSIDTHVFGRYFEIMAESTITGSVVKIEESSDNDGGDIATLLYLNQDWGDSQVFTPPTGDFIRTNNYANVDVFNVAYNGATNQVGQWSLRETSISTGDTLARIYASADDGVMDILQNNAVAIRLHGNGDSYFNGGATNGLVIGGTSTSYPFEVTSEFFVSSTYTNVVDSLSVGNASYASSVRLRVNPNSTYAYYADAGSGTYSVYANDDIYTTQNLTALQNVQFGNAGSDTFTVYDSSPVFVALQEYGGGWSAVCYDTGSDQIAYASGGNCAVASPFLDIYRNEELIESIEFSAELKTQSVKGWQSIEVKNIELNEYTFELSNKKPETDYIDSVELKVFGQYFGATDDNVKIVTLKPNNPKLVKDDNNLVILESSENISLSFEKLPIGFDVFAVKLVNNGYYVPYTYDTFESKYDYELVDFNLFLDKGEAKVRGTAIYKNDTTFTIPLDFRFDVEKDACKSKTEEQCKASLTPELEKIISRKLWNVENDIKKEGLSKAKEKNAGELNEDIIHLPPLPEQIVDENKSIGGIIEYE